MAVGLYSGVSGLAVGVGLYKGVSGLWGGSSGLINGFGGSGPFPGASLYLDFLTPPLDSRITFSRGTGATLVDSTGRITYAPANLLLRSEEFDNIAWTKTSGGLGVVPVVTANADVAPDGTTTADRIQFSVPGNTNGSGDFSVAVQIPAGSGPALCGSVWMRSNTGTNQTVFIRAGDTFLSLTVTPTWQRYSVTQSTASTAFTFNIGIRGSVTPNVTSADVLVWGAQLEPVTYQTTPGPYVATTASAYYGPRFDYDPATLAPRGLLIEEARTNLLTYSADWTSAAWTKSNLTVTAAATVSPDGTVNAQRLQATTTAGTNNSNAAVVAATAATYSIYVKQGSSPTAANTFALRNNTTATNLIIGTLNYATGVWTYSTGSTGVTVSNAGNGWWRLQISATTGITSGDTLICYAGFIGSGVTAGDFLFAYGAQLEAGAFATSYIPTVASTVSRSADVATMTGTNFSSWFNASAGTFIAETSLATAVRPRSEGILGVSNGSSAESTAIYRAGASSSIKGEMLDGGVVQASYTVAMGGQPDKSAFAYELNNSNFALNGAAQTTDTACTLPTVDRLIIGSVWSGGDFPANGHIRAIAYYNTRLPNTQLQTLTAPSLASPLALDFISPTYTVGY
jgi:hypothetical protein